jgi:hypothetical protein
MDRTVGQFSRMMRKAKNSEQVCVNVGGKHNEIDKYGNIFEKF